MKDHIVNTYAQINDLELTLHAMERILKRTQNESINSVKTTKTLIKHVNTAKQEIEQSIHELESLIQKSEQTHESSLTK